MHDTTTDTTKATPPREDVIEQVARLWAEGLAAQDVRTAEQAARAAGASKPEDITDWVQTHRPGEAVGEEPTAA